MDDFVLRAALAGIGVAIVSGPLGCFVVWRRMAFFGDTLAHSALLGVALGVVLGIEVTLGVTLICLSAALLLAAGGRRRALASDTYLGIISHGALALGLIAVSYVSQARGDLLAYLLGDILAVGPLDLVWIWGGGISALLLLTLVWRPLLAATVHEELARVEGVRTDLVQAGFMVLIALVVAVSMKVVGVILVTALLIVPAAAARRFAGTPEQMALVAATFGSAAIGLGLAASLLWNSPSGPSIVMAAVAIYLAGTLLPHSVVRLRP